jgi:hypothetical protein
VRVQRTYPVNQRCLLEKCEKKTYLLYFQRILFVSFIARVISEENCSVSDTHLVSIDDCCSESDWYHRWSGSTEFPKTGVNQRSSVSSEGAVVDNR